MFKSWLTTVSLYSHFVIICWPKFLETMKQIQKISIISHLSRFAIHWVSPHHLIGGGEKFINSVGCTVDWIAGRPLPWFIIAMYHSGQPGEWSFMVGKGGLWEARLVLLWDVLTIEIFYFVYPSFKTQICHPCIITHTQWHTRETHVKHHVTVLFFFRLHMVQVIVVAFVWFIRPFSTCLIKNLSKKTSRPDELISLCISHPLWFCIFVFHLENLWLFNAVLHSPYFELNFMGKTCDQKKKQKFDPKKKVGNKTFSSSFSIFVFSLQFPRCLFWLIMLRHDCFQLKRWKICIVNAVEIEANSLWH